MNDKKKTMPRTLPVLGDRFAVAEVMGLHDDDDLASALDGCQTGHRIKINADNDVSKRWRALLHETMHGALYVTGVQSVLDPNIEEIIVQTLETHVNQFMRLHGTAYLAAIKGDV